MPSHRRLSVSHQRTLQQIFQHEDPPIEWADLLHLVEEVGHVTSKGDGTYQLVVNGERHTLTRPHHDQIADPADLTAIRALFERGRVTP
jgi:hypothetical protein